MSITIYTHPSGLKHDTGPGHPESPGRLDVLLDLFTEMGLDTLIAPEADYEWVARAHSTRYLDTLQDAVPERGQILLDNDTVLSPASWDAAMHTAGAACRAVEDCIGGTTKRAFCAMRPPGHHAEPDRAMGFCLFNNVFIGALHAQSLGVERVAIVDFDVHHGNGSDAMARRHAGIFYASTHQSPLFPYTGDDCVPGRVLNVPLPAGTGPDGFRAAYTNRMIPALDDFRPQLVMLSAGFDAHRDDPLAQFDLGEDDFAWVTEQLCAVADRHAGGRVVSVLEGGYDLPALRRSVRAHLLSLDGTGRAGADAGTECA